MRDDIFVAPRSTREIEDKALAWRDALGISLTWVPNLVEVLELRLPQLLPIFSLLARDDSELGDAEGYTSFDPPSIVVSNRVYFDVYRQRRRARWTLAHEMSHLFLHDELAKPRKRGIKEKIMIGKIYNSTEWQANTFAAGFLMPPHIVSEFSTPTELSDGCCVSLQAAERRFRDVGRKTRKELPQSVKQFLAQFDKP